MTTKSEPPVFITSAGRSGSTIFFQLFTEHPNVAWMSSLVSRYPRYIRLNNLALNLFDLPLVGKRLLRNPRLGYPTEGYKYWDRHWLGFTAPFRDLLETDVTPGNRRAVMNALTPINTANRPHLVVKVTGWPRIRFLQTIYPQAKFIHMVRDGRSVANSYLNVNWWTGWLGPDNWAWGQLTQEQRNLWEEHDRSYIVLAGLNWTILMDAFEKATSELNESNFMLVHYHKFCEDPVGTFKRVVQFCGFDWSQAFEDGIRTIQLTSADDKWRRDLTPEQQQLLEEVTKPYLEKYSYLP